MVDYNNLNKKMKSSKMNIQQLEQQLMQIKVSNQKELDDILNQKQKEKEEDEKKKEEDIEELRQKISGLARTVMVCTKLDKQNLSNRQMYQTLENVCQYLKNGTDFVYGQKGGQKDYGL